MSANAYNALPRTMKTTTLHSVRAICLLLCLLAFGYAQASTTRLGLFLQGQRIGTATYRTVSDTLDGKQVQRSDSETTMSLGLLGSPVEIKIVGKTWLSGTRPIRYEMATESAGRSQKVSAQISGGKATIVVDNNGQRTERTVDVPADAPLADDPIALMMAGGAQAGSKRAFYILDPTTAGFVKNEAIVRGNQTLSIDGKNRSVTVIELVDPRANTLVYLDSKGELVKATGPMGIEMIPEDPTKPVAIVEPGYRPSVDLAAATSIRPDKPLMDPGNLRYLKLRITGRDLSRIPSDAHQTIKKDGDGWIVECHPVALAAKPSTTIAKAKQQKPEWIQPSLHIPSSSPQMKQLAAKIVGSRKTVQEASLSVRRWVYDNMRANSGIGVLRDATEVLASKEGVCRDYAILTATLTRAAGIPSRLASGLVNWDGTFYYHAWVEVWDGSRWLGIDSTAREEALSAAHIKLAHGQVDSAFTFTFLDKVKVNVLETKYR